MKTKRFITGFVLVMLSAGTLENVVKPNLMWATFAIGLLGCIIAISGLEHDN